MEIVLDPRSIQCLLGLGGALMVVGLVILLWANNYFTPPVMAIVLALSNLMLVGMGLAILRFSRYQMAGKALSLLSCLVMPLNLWYLHSNNLITIDGHLWVCARTDQCGLWIIGCRTEGRIIRLRLQCRCGDDRAAYFSRLATFSCHILGNFFSGDVTCVTGSDRDQSGTRVCRRRRTV